MSAVAERRAVRITLDSSPFFAALGLDVEATTEPSDEVVEAILSTLKAGNKLTRFDGPVTVGVGASGLRFTLNVSDALRDRLVANGTGANYLTTAIADGLRTYFEDTAHEVTMDLAAGRVAAAIVSDLFANLPQVGIWDNPERAASLIQVDENVLRGAITEAAWGVFGTVAREDHVASDVHLLCDSVVRRVRGSDG